MRDRIPEVFGGPGVRVLDEAEYPRALRAKLGEELADVLEVLHALAAVHGLSPAELDAARVARHRARGGFAARLWRQG